MAERKALLFDGISGSGKSTTSQLIYLDLLHKGAVAKWYYEHLAPHPVLSSQEIRYALDHAMPLEQAASFIIERVQSFVEAAKHENCVHVFESCLYQMIAGCLFRLNYTKTEIQSAIHQIEDCLAPLSPLLVYFHQPDVGAALRQTAAKRGEGFDQYLIEQFANTPYGTARTVTTFDDIIAAFQDFRELTDELFERSALDTHAVDTSSCDWGAVMNELSQVVTHTGYLGPAPLKRPLEEFEGVYQEANSSHE